MALRSYLSLIFFHRAGWSSKWPTLTCFLPSSAFPALPAFCIAGEVQKYLIHLDEQHPLHKKKEENRHAFRDLLLMVSSLSSLRDWLCEEMRFITLHALSIGAGNHAL